MKINDIVLNSGKPELYKKGSAVMWTDPYISEQLLDVHLNTEIDLASRKYSTIESTVEWILEQSQKEKMNILDLGCGPGLYSELLAKKGHNVTGVDFSENSIRYARKEAEKKKLDIKYLQENYLELDLQENQFDLVMLIFTDFGPLMPSEREQLLTSIKKMLRPDGIFILDVLNDTNLESKVSPKSWEVSEKGFWKNKPYLVLSESFLFKEEKVVLYQHIIVDEQDNVETYRFWNHFFSDNDLNAILSKQGFTDISFYRNVLPSGNGYTGADVTFCRAINSR
jgi:ubiquinone/menaquinone biosynthesis C-methylase UbiE